MDIWALDEIKCDMDMDIRCEKVWRKTLLDGWESSKSSLASVCKLEDGNDDD